MADEKFDSIVVGAGPAGVSAAITMARAGLNVALLERGEYAGAKNVQGAVLYSKMLEDVVPEFWKDCPLERAIVEERVFILTQHFLMNVTVEGPWQSSSESGMILMQKDKRGTMREFLLTSPKGILIRKLGLSKAFTPEVFTQFDPAVPRVIFPLQPGTKVHWEGRLKVAWVNKPILFDGEVLGWEDVEVPAGHFHCIKLHYHQKRGEDIVEEDAWYADSVGQVKYNGGQYVKELISFKKG